MTVFAWMAFLLAAAIGAPSRYVIDRFVQDRTSGAFPWGTFVVNVAGSFLLGLVAGLGIYRDLDATAYTVIGVGGIGAFTTFSTFTFETVRLIETGDVTEALRNAFGSILAGFAAVAAGLALVAAW